MIFNSFQFIWLFPVIFIVYWAVGSFFGCEKNKKVCNTLLLIISYGLYAQWNIAYTLILFGVTAVTYFFAKLIEKNGAYGKKQWVVASGVSLSLIPLLVFKYYNFITSTGASALAYIGIDQPLSGLNWVVPLGLSFYTFQAISYLCDVYYKKFPVEHNFLDYMLFVAFFPQILCGPISKASELLPQIKRPAMFDYRQAVSGLRFLLYGMFLKLVLADRLGIYVDTIYADYSHFSGSSCLIAAIFYSFQIYGDFAGYSFMALGVAKLMGYDIIKNFNMPYLATSVSGFWKRWNISLTRWLTSYIYIPLGGNRNGKARTYINILITFFVSGVWHGANYTFILWGCIHGVAQCIEKFFNWNSFDGKSIFSIAPRVLITFVVVTAAWIFFRMPTISDGFGVIGHIFTFGKPHIDVMTMAHSALALSLVIPFEMVVEFRGRRFREFISRHLCVRWGGYLFLLFCILLFGVLDSGQFIYVSF